MSAPRLIVTPGDPAGVGPEIVWKTLCSGEFQRKGFHILCVGARAPLEKLGAKILEVSDVASAQAWLDSPRKKSPHTEICLLPAPRQLPSFPQSAAALAGFQSGWSVSQAVRLVQRLNQSGKRAAIVTGPISKERLNLGGFPFAGHTELLAHLCRTPKATPKVTMMLANQQLRITLVTTHLALNKVSRALTAERIEATLDQTVSHLRHWWGIPRPKVAVAALNPHAGESGLFGDEEVRTIRPTIERYRRKNGKKCSIFGPLPADTLFATNQLAQASERFDAVVCMYHDQGLIPVKLLDFRQTVNITLGLPIVRTSVDHGVAFDIAGTGKADPTSFRCAMTLAGEILNKGTK